MTPQSDFSSAFDSSTVFMITTRAPTISSWPLSLINPRVTISGCDSIFPVCLSIAIIGTTMPSSERSLRSRITTSSIPSSIPKSPQPHPPLHHFGMLFLFPGVLADRNNRPDDAVFGKMLPAANPPFFNFFERPGTPATPPRRHRVAPVHAVFRKFDLPAVFQKQNFLRPAYQLMRQRGVPEQMPVLPVHRNEIFRLHQLQQKFLFFLAGVPRNVYRPR